MILLKDIMISASIATATKGSNNDIGDKNRRNNNTYNIDYGSHNKTHINSYGGVTNIGDSKSNPNIEDVYDIGYNNNGN